MNSALPQPPTIRPSHDRPQFSPPPTPRSWRAMGLALLVHGLLVVALTWGVSWKTSDEAASFSAELWTGQTAPTPTPPAPEVTTPPPEPRRAPPPPEPTRAEAPPTDVDIALQEEKKRVQLRKQQQQAQAEREARAKEATEKAAERKQTKLKEDQARLKKEQAAELAADKAEAAQLKAQQQAQAVQAAQAAQAAKAQREANLARLNAQLGSAGATGAPGGGSGKGSATQGAGASSGYKATINAAIRPNVVFTEDVSGNPTAEVEVRVTLDGTIISTRLAKPSNNAAWNEAALRAVERTRRIPKDVDGRIPNTTMILEMRPKD